MKKESRLSSVSLMTVIMVTLMCVFSININGQDAATGEVDITPPWRGTIFINPDIITENDPTTFQSLVYTGLEERRMFDRREGRRIDVDAFLFDAKYDDGLSHEIQVNSEFETMEEALKMAEKYAYVIGQMPTVLRKDVRTVSIHKGNNPFGGGNNNLLIHIGQSVSYERTGILEETMIHEASHTSLDAEHARAEGWLAAQQADGRFISTYARDFPFREDIAESFLLWVAVRYRADRIPEDLKNTIEEIMPNRLLYFDAQNFDMHPVE